MADGHAEIDFLELFVKLNLLIKRNLLVISLAFIAGASLGYLYFQFTPALYEGKMIISSDVLTESIAAQIHMTVNRLKAEQKLDVLSAKLSMSAQEVAQINRIVIERLEDTNRIDKDFALFRITFSVFDQSILPALQAGVVNLLRSNEFVQKRVAQRKHITEELLQRVESELHDLELLKERIAKAGMIREEKPEGSVLVFDPSSVHGRIILFSTERGRLKTLLLTAESIQVIDGVTVFDSPVSPRLSFSVAAGALFGIFCAALFIVFKVLRKVVERSDENRGRP